MTFSNALASITPSGTGNNATKIPSWHGYVYKTTTGMSDSDVTAGKYELRFVKSNGDCFVYTFDGVADYSYTGKISNTSGAIGTGSPVVGSTLTLDADLLEALAVDTWEIGSQAYYDENRTTEGEWN